MTNPRLEGPGKQSLITIALIVLLLLAGLPLAVWLDLNNLADANLRREVPLSRQPIARPQCPALDQRPNVCDDLFRASVSHKK